MVIKKENGKLWLPRSTWIRKPQTQIVPNKKRKINKDACRRPGSSIDEHGPSGN